MLKIKDVTVEFPTVKGVICPVDRVTLCIEKGEKHFIIGETGSGKSVLILSILGLSGGTVSGDIWFMEKNLITNTAKEWLDIRGKRIAYIPQGNVHSMNPIMKNGKQIAEPLLVHEKKKKKEVFNQVIDSMKKLDFQDAVFWAKQYPHNLSGGMKQRALVAMGTIMNGELLLADEPTKGLDEIRKKEVEDLFQKLEDTTLLCVTHDLDFVKKTAQKVSIMYAGQLLETALCEDFFEKPMHPYSKMLIAALPENGFHIEDSHGFAPSHLDYQNIGCRFMKRCPYKSDRCKENPPFVQMQGREVRCWKYADYA